VNSIHSFLAKSCTCIDCLLGNSFKHVHEEVRENMQKGIILGCGNRSNAGMDTVTLML
jgi:hypothetical protein